ncbi:uncharacterized protein LOC120602784 [Pteropus medius]|uniref:uncharacterized protein LOC120602784 n=1 Tax=Pteropus vampyrus TaxID=132908 RepID=UPI00196A4F89|nr:uncharacterized protein LOC120602784 [Pteropus giganteus]
MFRTTSRQGVITELFLCCALSYCGVFLEKAAIITWWSDPDFHRRGFRGPDHRALPRARLLYLSTYHQIGQRDTQWSWSLRRGHSTVQGVHPSLKDGASSPQSVDSELKGRLIAISPGASSGLSRTKHQDGRGSRLPLWPGDSGRDKNEHPHHPNRKREMRAEKRPAPTPKFWRSEVLQSGCLRDAPSSGSRENLPPCLSSVRRRPHPLAGSPFLHLDSGPLQALPHLSPHFLQGPYDRDLPMLSRRSCPPQGP